MRLNIREVYLKMQMKTKMLLVILSFLFDGLRLAFEETEVFINKRWKFSKKRALYSENSSKYNFIIIFLYI